MKPKSKFDWSDTGELKIRYDSETSSSFRFFPADQVISKTTAKLLKTPCIEPKRNSNINSLQSETKPKTGKNKKKNRTKEKRMECNNHMDCRKTYREFSDLANKAQRDGNFVLFSQAHKSMANVLNQERKYLDEIKSRIIAFYFDVSGISQSPVVDIINTEAIMLAAGNEGIGMDEIHDIFFRTINIDTAPSHVMTLMGSYKLLTLCLKKQWNKVDKIVNILK